ncbi:oxidoreductase [Actinoplanes ianthinogenes]|uniref:Oxidoreductase n=1 Tax=Actinoplanes ianthinogenes TaxID=122358 RepID=A0ABN6CQZ5_9ACTN|nr:FAD-dependent monooxygenase [Actinoplanes ianthinogenes]BCJ46607.1 oxidoreductase [Actinoplanes ianthinogenes]GGR17001.1 oxidoreductase [Actinoplanes ianthinogenes]
MKRTALISGAGIAGTTVAYWLSRNGWQTTIVERAGDLRSSGNPVDVRGPALPVTEQMGILPDLRATATQAKGMRILDGAGHPIARLPMSPGNGDVEILRGDLARVLWSTTEHDTELIVDDTITELRQDADGVDVTFERSAARRFDLVIGADGLHSAVRRIAFGPEREFTDHVGLYVATVQFGGPPANPDEVELLNVPGRLVGLHPGRGEAGAAFIFRHPELTGLGRRDIAAQKQLVTEVYQGIGWRVPELLDRMRDADDIYFDAVTRVQLDSWSRGRITLLGDAASCVSLFGDGSTMAIAGAHRLAIALADSPTDPQAALRRYEAGHRKLTNPKQRRVQLAATLLVPAHRLTLAARNTVARVLSRA